MVFDKLMSDDLLLQGLHLERSKVGRQWSSHTSFLSFVEVSASFLQTLSMLSLCRRNQAS